MARESEDWPAILGRLLEGDRVAFLRFSRLVSGFLVQLRAYDFEDEWEDLRQEVLLSVIGNVRAGRLRDPRAFVGYVRIITRNKFVDRLKRRLRHREAQTLPWDDESARAVSPTPGADEVRAARELWSALEVLTPDQRRILVGVYVEGKTYEQVSQDTGVPLGTLKRRLREGLELLRARLRGPVGEG